MQILKLVKKGLYVIFGWQPIIRIGVMLKSLYINNLAILIDSWVVSSGKISIVEMSRYFCIIVEVVRWSVFQGQRNLEIYFCGFSAQWFADFLWFQSSICRESRLESICDRTLSLEIKARNGNFSSNLIQLKLSLTMQR